MPRRALTTCTAVGCPVIVDTPGRCAEHRREADRRRGGGGERGSTARWKRFRKRYLAEHPVCECGPDCCPDGCWRLAVDVDHIDGTGRNGPRAYDESNLMPMAHECHSRKTARQDGGFGR